MIPVVENSNAYNQLADDLFALAHPVRLAIVQHLAEREACCNKDVVQRVGLAQSTVSQHLKVLVDAGLVSFSQDAQRSRYRLNTERLNGLANALSVFSSETCCCGPARAPSEMKAKS